MRRRTLFVLITTLLVFSMAVQAPAGAGRVAHRPAKTKNLIRNPGADAGKGARNASTVIKRIPGWSREGGAYTQATAVRYGAKGGFPGMHTPGPKDRGKNFFCGGPNNASQFIVQFVDVSAYKHAIDKGKVHYTLGAWLGGFKGQDDYAKVNVSFQDKSGMILPGAFTLGPADTHQKTVFVHKTATRKVPKKTRSIVLQPEFTRVSAGSYNDAYIDSMSLRLIGV